MRRMVASLCAVALLSACAGPEGGRGTATTSVVGSTTSGSGSTTATGALPSSTTSTTESPAPGSEAAWEEDMEVFGEFVRLTHPDPFWRTPEARFDAELGDAPPRLAAMTPDDAAVEVMRLAALIDGHSGVYPWEVGFHLYPLHLYLFPDGLHVVAAEDPALVGARVTAIGSTPVDEALERVRPYAAHDNDATIDVVVPMLLITPEVLTATGIVADGARPGYELRTRYGATVRLDPPMVDWDTFRTRLGGGPVGLPVRPEPLFLSRRDEPFWWTTLPGAGGPVHYLQYNSVRHQSGADTIQDAADAVTTALDDGAERVVIDLRHNPGGDNHMYGPLLTALRDDPRVNRSGALYVLIGRQTFSAAVNFATEVDTSTAAVFVGEPTGGRPNLYGDVRALRLPNSGVFVEVSSRYWPFGGPDDDRAWIAPDIHVTFGVDDLLAGRDPVLEASLDVSS